MTNPSNNTPEALLALAELEEAKAEEERAKLARIEAEEKLLPFLEQKLPSGTAVTHIGNTTVTTKNGVSYTCSGRKLARLEADERLADHPDLVYNKPTFDPKTLVALIVTDPAAFEAAMDYVSKSVSKVSISLTQKKES